MTRPEFTPRFLETATQIRERMLSNISDEYRKEKGDFIYDAIDANPAEIIGLQLNQDRVLQNAFPQYCEDDFLDLHLQLRGLKRIQATSNVRTLEIEADPGVRIDKGYKLTSVVLDNDGNPLDYTTNEETVFTDNDTILDVRITCSTVGLVGNIANGSEFILQPPIPGIRRITDKGTIIPAADKESLDAAWGRYLEKVENPDTGGNRNDYRRWVLENIPAVRKVIVETLWQGNGTVRIVCVGSDFKPSSPEVIDLVQTYLDPIPYQGHGYGKAPMGAVVTVITGEAKDIDIHADVVFTPNADVEAITSLFKNKVIEYLQSITFEEDPRTKLLYPIAYNKIGSIFFSIEGIENYSNLTINGVTEDIELIPFDIPTLGVVVFNE